MSCYQCPKCSAEIITSSTEIMTNSITDSKFENDPTLYCIHDDGEEIIEMNEHQITL